MLDVTIDRAMWDIPSQRPERNGIDGPDPFGQLVRVETGRMCCLGFVGLACGISKNRMLGFSMPLTIGRDNFPLWPEGIIKKFEGDDTTLVINGIKNYHLGWISTTVANDLMGINDTELIGDVERETKITELGKLAGIAFTFTGEYVYDNA